MLHTYVLTGGDRFINFVQWFASLASLIGVSVRGRVVGRGRRGRRSRPVLRYHSVGHSGQFGREERLRAGHVAGGGGVLRSAICRRWAVGGRLFSGRGAWARAPHQSHRIPVRSLACWLHLPGGKARFAKPAIQERPSPCALLDQPAALRAELWRSAGRRWASIPRRATAYYRWRNETLRLEADGSNVLRNVSDQLGARDEHVESGTSMVPSSDRTNASASR